jgi:hypothetical protein
VSYAATPPQRSFLRFTTPHAIPTRASPQSLLHVMWGAGEVAPCHLVIKDRLAKCCLEFPASGNCLAHTTQPTDCGLKKAQGDAQLMRHRISSSVVQV